MLDHMTQSSQILNSNLRELAWLKSSLINQQVSPRDELECPSQQSIG